METETTASYLPIKFSRGHESGVLCSHTDAELLFCEKGEVELALNGHFHILRPGELFLLPPFTPHTVTGSGAEACLTYLFDPRFGTPFQECAASPPVLFAKAPCNPFTGLLRYIDAHSDEELTLEQAACYAGFSRYHFSRLFHRYTGCTFSDYLTLRRIESAKALLATGSSITDVAFQAGFNSLSAFSRCFKKHTCCSPSEYRRLMNPVTPSHFQAPLRQ